MESDSIRAVHANHQPITGSVSAPTLGSLVDEVDYEQILKFMPVRHSRLSSTRVSVRLTANQPSVLNRRIDRPLRPTVFTIR